MLLKINFNLTLCETLQSDAIKTNEFDTIFQIKLRKQTCQNEIAIKRCNGY